MKINDKAWKSKVRFVSSWFHYPLQERMCNISTHNILTNAFISLTVNLCTGSWKRFWGQRVRLLTRQLLTPFMTIWLNWTHIVQHYSAVYWTHDRYSLSRLLANRLSLFHSDSCGLWDKIGMLLTWMQTTQVEELSARSVSLSMQ